MSASKRVGRPRISIEYFPARGVVKERALMTAAHALRNFQPDFQTVTFGAGGTGTDGSFEWSVQLLNVANIPTASHITLSHFRTRDELFAFTDELWEVGIRGLVVLRGDPGEGRDGLCGYGGVAEAVSDLKGLHKWDISVSAYPETHPLAESGQADIEVLRAKQEAGADRAITQFFFDNSDFYAFRDRAEKAGITIPIVAGIMPIVNFKNITRFAEGCGARVPSQIADAFAVCGDDKERHSNVARRIVGEQVRDLAANGVDAIHVYSMNRVDLTADAIRAFQSCFEEEVEELRRAG
jgi:methylenetetrahydrofolate reductase (NADPH)